MLSTLGRPATATRGTSPLLRRRRAHVIREIETVEGEELRRCRMQRPRPDATSDTRSVERSSRSHTGVSPVLKLDEIQGTKGKQTKGAKSMVPREVWRYDSEEVIAGNCSGFQAFRF